MVRKKIEATEMIKPLFLPVDKGFSINHLILQFAKDDYNKVIGETLIGAGNDAEAVAVFLQEYQDSPETLRGKSLMSRLNILTKDEINLFDKPPRFLPEQRQKYFHLNEKLISLLKSLRSATNKVCLVLQWGYFRASGRFFLIQDAYSTDIRYVAEMLNIPQQAIQVNEYREKRKIAFEHQRMILKAMNFRHFDKEAKAWLQMQLENLIAKHMQPRDMIYYLASQCHQQQIEILTYHYFAQSITLQYR